MQDSALPAAARTARGLFVTDLDGTLLTADGVVPPRNLEAMRRANEAGVVLAVVTGRRRSTTRRERAKLDGVDLRWSVCNGAVVLGDDHERPEALLDLDWEAVRVLADLPSLRHAPIFCITWPPEPPPGEAEEAEVFVVMPDTRRWLLSHVPWDVATRWETATSEIVEPAAAHRRRLVHVAVVLSTREAAEEGEASVRSAFGASAAVHTVKSPRGTGALIEAVPAGGKANAVAHLVRQLGVPPQATGAIGDEMNDAALLDAARWRYAVGGSVLASRRRDAVEVGTAEGGAVADALDRFLAVAGLGA